MTDLVERARIFSYAAHAAVGQKRKYSGRAYIEHPESVFKIVKTVPHTEEMLAAAWLHDVVEDTHIDHDDIYRIFGPTVKKLVWYLTDISKPEDGNRATRKAIDRQHLAEATPEAQTIKLADLIDNTHSIVENDPNFAVVYLREKRLLLEVMDKGDPTLYKICRDLSQQKPRQIISVETDILSCVNSSPHS